VICSGDMQDEAVRRLLSRFPAGRNGSKARSVSPGGAHVLRALVRTEPRRASPPRYRVSPERLIATRATMLATIECIMRFQRGLERKMTLTLRRLREHARAKVQQRRKRTVRLHAVLRWQNLQLRQAWDALLEKAIEARSDPVAARLAVLCRGSRSHLSRSGRRSPPSRLGSPRLLALPSHATPEPPGPNPRSPVSPGSKAVKENWLLKGLAAVFSRPSPSSGREQRWGGRRPAAPPKARRERSSKVQQNDTQQKPRQVEMEKRRKNKVVYV